MATQAERDKEQHDKDEAAKKQRAKEQHDKEQHDKEQHAAPAKTHAGAADNISHPSVAAIVHEPGAAAGPDQPAVLVHSGSDVDAEARTIPIPPREQKPAAEERIFPVVSDQTERVRPVSEEQLARSEANEKNSNHIVGGLRPGTGATPGVVPGVRTPAS